MTIEIDDARNRNWWKWTQWQKYWLRQKAIEQELGYKFIRIDPDKEDFNVFRAIIKYLGTLNNRLKKSNK